MQSLPKHETRRGPYYPHFYIVKEDGEPPLCLWALSCLQFITQFKDKVGHPSTIMGMASASATTE
ncbi:hypothetical protein DFH11DRAFT_1608257 [Phellopilus nigrolimitatus]|nr:hypothetical protein DFH11DRAFT_1608257 [Phellopilus nigrolimitatus]